jgi:hypothetical protein
MELGALVLLVGFVGLMIFGEPDTKRLRRRDIPIYVALAFIVIGGSLLLESLGGIDHPPR